MFNHGSIFTRILPFILILNINPHSLLPHIHQTRRAHAPILLLDIRLDASADGIFLARERISQFFEWDTRLVADQIFVDGVVFKEVVGGVERASFEGGGVVVTRGLDFEGQ
jgi:hypothetical protein